MQLDDTLYKAFLEELQDLEKFRMSYAALHPAAPLDREDQDVRRLIEARRSLVVTRCVLLRRPGRLVVSHNYTFYWLYVATSWPVSEVSRRSHFQCSRPNRPNRTSGRRMFSPERPPGSSRDTRR